MALPRQFGQPAWVIALFIVAPIGAYAAGNTASFPAPALDDVKLAGKPQTAVLAGGCFWGMQAVF